MPSCPISVDRPQHVQNSPLWNIFTCRRTSIAKRGNRRAKVNFPAGEVPADAPAAGSFPVAPLRPPTPASEEPAARAPAAAARAFLSFPIQSIAAAFAAQFLIAVQQISRL